MKNLAAIIILLSSFIFAEETNTAADSLSSGSTGSGIKPSYSLGVISGAAVAFTPKFIASNILNDYELQVHGMYFGSHYNFGLDLNYIVFKKENLSHSIGVGGGIENGEKIYGNNFFGFEVKYIRTNEDLQSAFAKINYSFKWKFVFLQVGTAIGNGNYSVPRFKSQLGLMYNF